jgi:succinate dehydrogenase/fumarate reductase flavoprotein subunit
VNKHIGAFLFGLGMAFAAAFTLGAVQRRRVYVAGWREPLVDINSATREQLMSLGIVESTTLDRLLENRPYRNKLDLIARMVVSEDIYEQIKRDIVVRKADEPIKVAG